MTAYIDREGGAWYAAIDDMKMIEDPFFMYGDISYIIHENVG